MRYDKIILRRIIPIRIIFDQSDFASEGVEANTSPINPSYLLYLSCNSYSRR